MTMLDTEEDVYLTEGVFVSCWSVKSGISWSICVARKHAHLQFLDLDSLLRSVEALKNQIEDESNKPPFFISSKSDNDMELKSVHAAWRLITSIGLALTLVQADGRDRSWQPVAIDLFSRVPKGGESHVEG